MESVKYILGDPKEFVDDIQIHPVQLKDYDEFMQVANILTLSYDHFHFNGIDKEGHLKLLELILNHYLPEQKPIVIQLLLHVFTFVCKQNVVYDQNLNAFFIEDTDLAIDKDNYDEIRRIILRQNLIFEPKLAENKLVQEWFDLAIQEAAESALKYTVEDMITLIVAYNGMDIDKLAKYTIYQVNGIFKRIMKLQSYRTTTLFKTVSNEVSVEHFAEKIDMFKNPYDDILGDSSELNEIKNIVSGKF